MPRTRCEALTYDHSATFPARLEIANKLPSTLIMPGKATARDHSMPIQQRQLAQPSPSLGIPTGGSHLKHDGYAERGLGWLGCDEGFGESREIGDLMHRERLAKSRWNRTELTSSHFFV
jgi:hypothetical protein